MVVETDGGFVDSHALLGRLEAKDLSEEALLDSMRILEDHGLVEVHRTLGSGIEAASSFSLTGRLRSLRLRVHAGVERNGDEGRAEFVNGGEAGDRLIAEETGVQRVVVEHIFDVLESRGLVRVTRMSGPSSHVFDVSPQLKRLLESAQG
jgi:hypothetical protein